MEKGLSISRNSTTHALEIHDARTALSTPVSYYFLLLNVFDLNALENFLLDPKE
jgi:hypothetical protein